MKNSEQTRLRPASSIPEKMIKVNHAGENGAVNIYRGQQVFGRIVAPKHVQKLVEYESHESNHRSIFAAYLERHSIRKCFSYHLCGIGGFVLGLLTGLLGRQIIAATSYAVENVVVKHLHHQLDYLAKIDSEAFECVSRILEDEESHLEESESEFQISKPINKLMIAIVSFSTNAVIGFGMR